MLVLALVVEAENEEEEEGLMGVGRFLFPPPRKEEESDLVRVKRDLSARDIYKKAKAGGEWGRREGRTGGRREGRKSELTVLSLSLGLGLRRY